MSLAIGLIPVAPILTSKPRLISVPDEEPLDRPKRKYSKADVVGQVFGNWTILQRKGPRCIARCVCGNVRERDKYSIVKLKSKSCGCIGWKSKENDERITKNKCLNRNVHTNEARIKYATTMIVDLMQKRDALIADQKTISAGSDDWFEVEDRIRDASNKIAEQRRRIARCRE